MLQMFSKCAEQSSVLIEVHESLCKFELFFVNDVLTYYLSCTYIDEVFSGNLEKGMCCLKLSSFGTFTFCLHLSSRS
jgi:hypothetical protein